jgi:hypothetical protein
MVTHIPKHDKISALQRNADLLALVPAFRLTTTVKYKTTAPGEHLP